MFVEQRPRDAERRQGGGFGVRARRLALQLDRKTSGRAFGLDFVDIAGRVGIGDELHLAKAFPPCVAVMDKAVALKDAAELRTERAACKIGLQDDAGAVIDLKAAAASDPSYAPAHYYLGNELAKGGDFAAAITAYQTFLKLEPNGPLAKAVTEKIRLAKAPHH